MPLKIRKSAVREPPPTCPLTECMKLLGGAWTPNLIWFLSKGPRRFGELRADIPRISAKVLSDRLRSLEGRGLLHRHVMPTSPPSVEYSLSELGSELIPVIHAIVRVGKKLKTMPPEVRSRRAARSARPMMAEPGSVGAPEARASGG